MNRLPLIPRLCGWLLLLVHLAGQMQGLPLLAAAVAALDGAHEVEISNSQSGLCLVLHHDRNGTANDSLPAPHHHRGLVRLLAGTDDEGPHPDHRLEFTSSPLELKAGEATLALGVINHSMDSNGELGYPSGLAVGVTQTAMPTLDWQHRWWPPAPADCAWGCVVLLI